MIEEVTPSYVSMVVATYAALIISNVYIVSAESGGPLTSNKIMGIAWLALFFLGLLTTPRFKED